MEKNALVARSKCYILLGQPKNGLKDAEAALAIDKSFIKAIFQKAESLYYLGDFEHSLMYYHRGLRLRPDHEGFKLGVHKAQKAIENAIGSSLLSASKSNTRNPTPKSSKQSTAREKAFTPETITRKLLFRSTFTCWREVSFLKVVDDKKQKGGFQKIMQDVSGINILNLCEFLMLEVKKKV